MYGGLVLLAYFLLYYYYYTIRAAHCIQLISMLKRFDPI